MSDDHRVSTEPSPRRVRAVLAGETIADSTHVLLLSETRHLPVYYFPADDVRMDLLERTDKRTRCPYKGEASYWSIRVCDRVSQNAVWAYEDPIEGREDIKGHLAFYWNRVDAWYEEDDEVFVHPRDPHHRVDVLNSSRHVKIVVGGVVVAESRRPRLLFETGLPTRYYLPKLDVRMDLLTPTDTTTRCPYKGVASYWSVDADGRHVDDVVWTYSPPIPECPKIDNLLAFFQEKVDEVWVDGELEPKPHTPWS
jgi:uncharacterized protein (DUF427 family)